MSMAGEHIKNNKEIMLRDLNRLYAVMEEIASEHDRLSDKLIELGNDIPVEEKAQLKLLSHLINVYSQGGNNA